MLCKGKNVMQGNTMINDSISKDVSSHLSWSLKKKQKEEKNTFTLACDPFCQIWFDSAEVDYNIRSWILSVYMRCTFLACA